MVETIGVSGIVCGFFAFIIAAGNSIRSFPIHSLRKLPTSLRRCPVSMRRWTIVPNGYPIASAALHTATSSLSERTRSRLGALPPGIWRRSQGLESSSPRRAAKRKRDRSAAKACRRSVSPLMASSNSAIRAVLMSESCLRSNSGLKCRLRSRFVSYAVRSRFITSQCAVKNRVRASPKAIVGDAGSMPRVRSARIITAFSLAFASERTGYRPNVVRVRLAPCKRMNVLLPPWERRRPKPLKPGVSSQ